LFFCAIGAIVTDMRYEPYGDLDGRPNLIVDGAAADGTLLTLSHWPGSDVLPSLRADLSAEIAVRYLEQPEVHVPAEVVSNNHFDEDGLMGVFALVDPTTALAHRERLIDVARAGDFGRSQSRDAARISFAVSTLVDPQASPLDAAVFDGDYPPVATRLYRELLPRVPELLAGIDAFRALWADEDAHLTASDELLDNGKATIVERPDLDLAIVTVPADVAERTMHRFTQRRSAGLHPMAVHNRTQMTRVAYLTGPRYEVQLRYETWVQLVSWKPLPRPDLGVLAARLDEIEASGGSWTFDGARAITPALTLHGAPESSITPERFLSELCAFLPDAAPAWDPWAARV
jgi:hypothetical protein